MATKAKPESEVKPSKPLVAKAIPAQPTFTDVLCAMGDVLVTIRMTAREGFARVMIVDFARAGHSVSKDLAIYDGMAANLMEFAQEADKELPR